MSKQTAVEWVLQKILLENGIVNSDIEQALKMEKEQHEMTFNEALNEDSSRSFENITKKLLKLASLFGGKPKQELEKLKKETK